MHTHLNSSAEYLTAYVANSSAPAISLVYSDLGDPIGAWDLHLEKAELLTTNRDRLLSEGAIVLIDDVRNMATYQPEFTRKHGQPTNQYGKSRDSIPYMLRHGWKAIFEGYQWIMQPPPSFGKSTGTNRLLTSDLFVG